MPASFVSQYRKLLKDKIEEIFKYIIREFLGDIFPDPSSIIFLGLDYAGKTTLIKKLNGSTESESLPTRHTIITDIKIDNLKLKALDVGGHDTVRAMWKTYFAKINGLVFIIDISDSDRFSIVKEGWDTVRENINEREIPILVFVNKIDLIKETTETISTENRIVKNLISSIDMPLDNEYIKVMFLSIKNDEFSTENSEIRKGFKWLSTRIKEIKKRTEKNESTSEKQAM